MANRYATKTGNWSDVTVWDGGTLPQPGDVVRPNNFTVTIDQDITVAQLTNSAAAPAVANGTFVVSGVGPRIINSNLLTTGSALVSITNAGADVTVNGAVTSGASNGSLSIGVNARVTINGDVTGGAGTSNIAVVIFAGPVLTVNGNVTGGTGTNAHALSAQSGSSSVITVNGNILGTGNSYPVLMTVVGTLVVTGSCTAGAVLPAINSTAAVSLDLQGPLIASSAAPAVRSTSAAAVIRCRGPFFHAVNNRTPIVAEFFMVYRDVNTRWEMKDDSASPAGGANVIMTNYVEDSPAPSDVRAGVAYGPVGTLTGALDMPPPSAVASGVPVDDTVGTAALTQAKVAEVVGEQLAAALNPVGSG
jgi:hypothetical protein